MMAFLIFDYFLFEINALNQKEKEKEYNTSLNQI